VLVIAVIGGDVTARHVAQHLAADRMGETLRTTDRPSVHLDGTPFLTQLIRGRYERVRVQIEGAAACQVRIAHAQAVLHGVRRHAGGVRAEQVSGGGVLTYDDLSAAVAPLRVSAGPAGSVTVTGGLGALGFSAEAVPRLDGDTLVVASRSAAASADGVPMFAGSLTGFPPIRVQLRRIPTGLAVSVTPGPEGLAFSFTGHEVDLDDALCA